MRTRVIYRPVPQRTVRLVTRLFAPEVGRRHSGSGARRRLRRAGQPRRGGHHAARPADPHRRRRAAGEPVAGAAGRGQHPRLRPVPQLRRACGCCACSCGAGRPFWCRSRRRRPGSSCAVSLRCSGCPTSTTPRTSGPTPRPSTGAPALLSPAAPASSPGCCGARRSCSRCPTGVADQLRLLGVADDRVRGRRQRRRHQHLLGRTVSAAERPAPTSSTPARCRSGRAPRSSSGRWRCTAQSHPDSRLVFLGQGSDRGAPRGGRRASWRPGAVDFLGVVPPEEAARWLRGAVAALVSIRPGQGYDFARPTKIYAATACGTPVVFAGEGAGHDLVTGRHWAGRPATPTRRSPPPWTRRLAAPSRPRRATTSRGGRRENASLSAAGGPGRRGRACEDRRARRAEAGSARASRRGAPARPARAAWPSPYGRGVGVGRAGPGRRPRRARRRRCTGRSSPGRRSRSTRSRCAPWCTGTRRRKASFCRPPESVTTPALAMTARDQLGVGERVGDDARDPASRSMPCSAARARSRGCASSRTGASTPARRVDDGGSRSRVVGVLGAVEGRDVVAAASASTPSGSSRRRGRRRRRGP